MILKYGARGDEVVLVQKKLKELGFKGQTGKPLSIDGIFGESTEFAVIQFQKNKGILVDGKVGIKPVLHLRVQMLVNCSKTATILLQQNG